MGQATSYSWYSMSSTGGNLWGCVQRHLYPVHGFQWTAGWNEFTVIYSNKKYYLPYKVIYYNFLMIHTVSRHWNTLYHKTKPFAY